MNSDDQKPNLDDVKAELQSKALNSISKISKYLTAYYGGYFPDDTSINREYLKMLASMVGEMLACFPDDLKDQAADEVYQYISYHQDLMEVELTKRSENLVDKGIETSDLAKMTTRGNC